MSLIDGPRARVPFRRLVFSLPFAGQGDVGKAKAAWPSTSFELILLPLAGSATRADAQAMDTGEKALTAQLSHLKGRVVERGEH